MNLKLRLAALGIAIVPLIDGAIQLIDDGFLVGALKIPSILITFALVRYLLQGKRWTFGISAIFLSLFLLLGGPAIICLGFTSEFYPTWKIVSYSVVLLICAASLYFLFASRPRVTDS